MRIKRELLCCFLLFSVTTLIEAVYWQDQPVVSCFFPRPYTPRSLPGNSRWWEFDDACENDLRFFAQLEGSVAQTFRPERITQCLFGGGVENCYQTLCVSGSQTSGRGNRTIVLKEHHRKGGSCHTPYTQRIPFSVDWLADYFWLPTDFVSELRFKPVINTYRATPSFHSAYLINDCTALEGEIFLPIEHTTWNIHLAEKVRSRGVNADAAGSFAADPIDRTDLLPNARSFFGGSAPAIPGITVHHLQHAKIASCPQDKTALNCAYMKLGVYSTPGEWLLYGLGAILSAPAGTVPTGEYLFEPLVGDGHYWRYGLEAYMQFHLFNDIARCGWGLLTFETTFTSCAPSSQKRTFDLCNSPNSRYMLIHKPHDPTPEYSYLANISTLDVKVHIDILFEISATLTYATPRSNWSFGYRFWARSDDSISIPCPEQFPSNTWALKGDSHVYGFAIPPGALPAGTPQRIPVSESKATMESGTNIPAQGSTNPTTIAAAQRNPRVDNPEPASTELGQPLAASPTDLTLSNQVNQSDPPKLLTINDLNIKSACSTGMLHTVFTILDTQLNDLDDEVAIHLYMRGEIDCGKASTAVPPACFDQCVNIAPSQWEVALGLYIDF